jgi:protein-disulfide isomerase
MNQTNRRYLGVALGTVFAAALGLVIVSACNNGEAKEKPNFIHKDAPKPGIVAKIGGQEITEEELIGDDKLDFFDLKKREYDLKMDRLNRLVIERMVGAEAKKAGMSLQDYIEKKVTGGEVKISDREFKKFVADKHIPEGQINPQIKERIINYLQSQKKQDEVQAYVAKLTRKQPVEVYFAKPKMQVQVEMGQGTPTFGKSSAAVTIVEFSDFQCPFCARGAETVTQIKKKYGSKVFFGFRHFPLPMHKDARPASEAAACVGDQSSDKFYRFHDILFKNQSELNPANFEKWAKEVGADAKKWKECFEGKKDAAKVQADMDYGEKIGVKSTPTFFVNGQLVSGALPLDSFSEIIDEELSAKK